MNKKVLWALVILVCLFLGWHLYLRLEWREQRLDLGWLPEADRSPHLAMKMLLEQFGVEHVEIYRIVPSLDQLNDAYSIFLPDASFIPQPSQQMKVLEWVESGGHLVIGSGYSEFPPLLARLGFSTDFSNFVIKDSQDDEEKGSGSLSDLLLEQSERVSDIDEQSESDTEVCMATLDKCNELVEPDVDTDELTSLFFDGVDDSLAINFRVSRSINHPAIDSNASLEDSAILNSEPYQNFDVFYWGGDNDATRFVQGNYGEGIITTMVDPGIFSNAYLAHFDHAYLLHLLFGRSDHIVILEGKHTAPLSTLLWRHYRESLIGFFLILCLSAWYLFSRFGAVRDTQTIVRRSREEGMQAIGQWYWRNRDFTVIVTPLRSDIIQAATLRWPGFRRWSVDKQYEKIAELCELEPDWVAELMEREKCEDEQTLLRFIQNLQHIRTCL